MKILKFTFTLLAVLILASCTTTKISYNEYTTRQTDPVMTDPYITPTVADLEVSQTKETIAETFTNDLTLKSKFDKKSIERWKEVTLEKMMKEFNSDVIVAPIFSISTSNDMKNINVEVSGYPAKYTNFRNMQVADSAAMRIHGIEIARHGTTYYENIKKVKTKTSRNTLEITERMSRIGTFFSPEIGVNMGVLSGGMMILDLQATYGKQINKYFGIGGGAGIFTRNYSNYDNKLTISLPVFVNARGYFFETGVTPYYSVDMGFILPIFKARNDEYGFNTNHYLRDYVETTTTKKYVKGFMFAPEIGIAFGKMNIGLECKFYKNHLDREFTYVNNMPSSVTNYISQFEDMYGRGKDKCKTFFIKLGLVL